MKLTLKRIAKRPLYTIGRLLDEKGNRICDTLEDTDRGLRQGMSSAEIKAKKIKSKTAIPTGTYEIALNVRSPKYSNFTKYPYARLCDGKMPRVLNVIGYDGILIHAGNSHEDTDGCILVGQNTVVGKVTSSQMTFTQFYTKYLKPCKDRGEKVYITII